MRVITRLDETCREVRDAARVIGDAELFKKMEEAQIKIKRDSKRFSSSLLFHTNSRPCSRVRRKLVFLVDSNYKQRLGAFPQASTVGCRLFVLTKSCRYVGRSDELLCRNFFPHGSIALYYMYNVCLINKGNPQPSGSHACPHSQPVSCLRCQVRKLA